HVAHQKPNCARALVATLFALSVRGLARAWQRGKRSLIRAQYLSVRNLRGRFGEEIATSTSFATVQKAMILQLQKDEFQETARYAFARCKIRNKDGALAVFLGEHRQRFKRVFGLLGNHLGSTAKSWVIRTNSYHIQFSR